MLLPIVNAILTRELRAVRRTVEAYPDDASLWRAIPGVPNTGGTLVLHCAGNIEHFIGTVLGGSSYVRDRDAEFARRDVPRAELLRLVDSAIDSVQLTFNTLDESATELPYEVPIANRRFRTDEVLVHLAVHLAFHLGQLDYHRRTVTGDPTSVNPIAAAELHDLLGARA